MPRKKEIEPRYRIMLVDDDPISLWIVGLALTRANYHVSAISDGNEAIEELRAADYDMLITDIQMPHIDGLTLLDWVARHRPDLKSMVITAHGTPSVRETCLSRGAVLFLQKPVDNKLLVETVTHYVNLQSELGSSQNSMKKLIHALEEAASAQVGGEVLVCSKNNVARVFFVKDEIAWVVIASEENAFMEHLISKSGVGKEDLKAAYRECKIAGGNFAETLVSWGLVDPGMMRIILLEQMARSVKTMGNWESLDALFAPQTRHFAGSYTFGLTEVLGAVENISEPVDQEKDLC